MQWFPDERNDRLLKEADAMTEYAHQCYSEPFREK